jgi:hypothetical protein
LKGLDGMRAPGLGKPGAFLWLIRLRQFGVEGIAGAVFGERLLAYVKRWRSDCNAAILVSHVLG